MPSIELLIAFAAAGAVFAYMPGPAMLYAAAQTVARGRMAGLMASIGIHVGGYVHVLAAALGLAALFHAVPALFAIVKIAGAGYLIWLGVKMVREAGRDPAALPAARAQSARLAFAESVIVEVSNPKAALFFFAFLPQFADSAAAAPLWLQLLALGAVANVMFLSADLACVALAGAVTDRLRRSGRAQRLVKRAGGAALIGLGANLALQKT
ncbi:MAG: LysE family translocator [Caulobacterales bacterium]|nr:LysE family translocator [Caulobacterales bacterium]